MAFELAGHVRRKDLVSELPQAVRKMARTDKVIIVNMTDFTW
jgi:hypothetical protein